MELHDYVHLLILSGTFHRLCLVYQQDLGNESHLLIQWSLTQFNGVNGQDVLYTLCIQGGVQSSSRLRDQELGMQLEHEWGGQNRTGLQLQPCPFSPPSHPFVWVR